MVNTSACQVEFVGGPSDGLVLNGPHFKAQDKLQIPAIPALVRRGQTDSRELVGHWSAAYLLASAHRIVEDRHSTICLRYDFLGYEPLQTQSEREPLSQQAPRWLVGLSNWFAQIPSRFASWMLKPIDYPLRV